MDLFGWTMNKDPGLNMYYLEGIVLVDAKTMMLIRPCVNSGIYEKKDASMPEMAIRQ
jgi:hypothetical protein